MTARVSIHVPLVLAIGLSALTLLAIVLRGPEPRTAAMFFLASAYLFGDAMGAAIRSVRGTFFSRLLPTPRRRMWRQAAVWSLMFLTPSVLVIGWTGGLDLAFWLFSLELLALSSGLTLASWLPRIELRYLAAILLIPLVKTSIPWTAPAASWSLWHQGLLSLLFCVPVLALFLLAFRRSILLGRAKAHGSRYTLQRRWFPIERIPLLSASSSELPSDAHWHRWLRLAVFESGPTPWWLPLLVAPPLFATLLLLPNFVPGLPGPGTKIWSYLLALAVGAITLLSAFKGPRLELSLRYPISRRAQAKLVSTAASLSTLLCLASSLSLLGLLWLAQVRLGLNAVPLPLASALGFVIFSAAFVTLLQDARKLGVTSLTGIIWFLFYLDVFDSVFLGNMNSDYLAFMLTAAIAIFSLVQVLIWLIPRHTIRHGDLHLPGTPPGQRAWQ